MATETINQDYEYDEALNLRLDQQPDEDLPFTTGTDLPWINLAAASDKIASPMSYGNQALPSMPARSENTTNGNSFYAAQQPIALDHGGLTPSSWTEPFQPPQLFPPYYNQDTGSQNLPSNQFQPQISYAPFPSSNGTVGQTPQAYNSLVAVSGFGAPLYPHVHTNANLPMRIGQPGSRQPPDDKTNRVQGPSRITKSTSRKPDSPKSSHWKKAHLQKFMQFLKCHAKEIDQGLLIPYNTLRGLGFSVASPTQPLSRVSTRSGNIDNNGAFAPTTPLLSSSRSRRQQQQQEIANGYRGYQREFRNNGANNEARYKCTLGCTWSHEKKSNWERHEKTHYPPEIWICFEGECLDKTVKHRVSFRKDLARRHYNDYHQSNGGKEVLAKITDVQLEDLKVEVENSLFPRECVFDGCDEKFETFEDRSRHTEAHLRAGDTLLRDRIKQNYPDKLIKEESDDAALAEFDNGNDNDNDQNNNSNDDDDDDDDDNDDDEDEDDDEEEDDGNDGDTGAEYSRNQHFDRDGGTGAGGSSNGHSMAGGSTAGRAAWQNNSIPEQQYYQRRSQGAGGYAQACSFDTFGGNGFIPQTDKRPWKSLTSLRLQLLPQVFARGISQTPLVLKKIQLQAAMALEMTGVSKLQITRVLRREIAIMVNAMSGSSRSTSHGLLGASAITKLQAGLQNTVSSSDVSSLALQDRALAKFADFDGEITSEKDPTMLNEDEDSALVEVVHRKGGHIYRCLPMVSTTSPIRPSRLVHVGSWSAPKLHLDTSDVLPHNLIFCSVSHCWNDGHGLYLSSTNAASLRKSIPPDDLTQTFHLAISIARDKGIEYIWVDTLCIMQDSDEDIKAEAPRITQIHASATFAIVITSMAYNSNANKTESLLYDHKEAGEQDFSATSMSDTASDVFDVPDLTIADTIETASSQSPARITRNESINRAIERRDSHQLEVRQLYYRWIRADSIQSFLAEPPAKSFFSPRLSLSQHNKTAVPSTSSTPTTSSHYFRKFLPWHGVGGEVTMVQPREHAAVASGYLDKWHIRWNKMSRSQPQSPVASPEPSISDFSVRSEKRKALLTVLPNAMEKLFHNLKRKDALQIESTTSDG